MKRIIYENNLSKVPKDKIGTISNESVWKDYYYNNINSLLEWNIHVLKDKKTQRLMENAQKAVQTLTEYLKQFHGGVVLNEQNKKI